MRLLLGTRRRRALAAAAGVVLTAVAASVLALVAVGGSRTEPDREAGPTTLPTAHPVAGRFEPDDTALVDCEPDDYPCQEQAYGNLAFDDSGSVSGTWVKESDRTPDERTRVYIMVDAIGESLERIVKAGGKVLTPRTEIGPAMGAFAAFLDPVGNEFGLYEEPAR